jgi:hypothetical protein
LDRIVELSGAHWEMLLWAFGFVSQIRAVVKASIDEAMKLERAMSQLRTAKRVVVLHCCTTLLSLRR